MFLRFGFSNHRSFRDPVEVSFAAGALNDLPHVRFPVAAVKHGLLPVVAIFGANASGKSNVLRALGEMIQHIRFSHARLAPGEAIPRAPFKLDRSARDAPTRYDCDVVLGGVRYHYGFTFSNQSFDEEWLYAWPSGHKQLWFHRAGQAREGWYFGPALKGQRARIAELTRDNSLFLATAAQNNHAELGALYAYFSHAVRPWDGWPVNTPRMWSESLVHQVARQPQVLEFLRQADLGIVDFRVEDRQELIERLISDFAGGASTQEIAAELSDRLSREGAPKEVILGHRGADGDVHWLDGEDESDGTHATLNMLHVLLPALEQGHLVLVDELDRSLHPQLVLALIGLFTDPVANPNGAQLLFTTHDVEVLTTLRRDEVVLVEKDNAGISRLTPLSDYRPRNRDDLRRSYLEGRYGGVPRLGILKRALVRGNP